MLARNAILRPNQPSRILARFTPDSFPKLFTTVIGPYLEVTIQGRPPVLRKDKYITDNSTGGSKMTLALTPRLNPYTMEHK